MSLSFVLFKSKCSGLNGTMKVHLSRDSVEIGIYADLLSMPDLVSFFKHRTIKRELNHFIYLEILVHICLCALLNLILDLQRNHMDPTCVFTHRGLLGMRVQRGF